MIELKEYKESITYIIIMLIIFSVFYFYIRMSFIISGFYGFIVGSGLYFGCLYGYKKRIEKN